VAGRAVEEIVEDVEIPLRQRLPHNARALQQVLAEGSCAGVVRKDERERERERERARESKRALNVTKI
jgi:hypothetical protein